jgi:hypothetical protein
MAAVPLNKVWHCPAAIRSIKRFIEASNRAFLIGVSTFPFDFHFGAAVEYYSGAFRISCQAGVQFFEILPAKQEIGADRKFTKTNFIHQKRVPSTVLVV